MKRHNPIIFCPTAQMSHRGVVRSYVNQAYSNAITRAGGILVTVPSQSVDHWCEIITETVYPRGILLQGGCDINPCRSGAIPSGTCTYDDGRDDLELALARYAVLHQIPIFGICRGMQVLNVAHGGTLRDLEGDELAFHQPGDEVKRWMPVHRIEVNRYFRTTIGASEVNSRHHQAIDRLAPSFRVLAESPDRVVEAIAYTNGEQFCFGVQWHPEEMECGNIITCFVDFVGQQNK